MFDESLFESWFDDKPDLNDVIDNKKSFESEISQIFPYDNYKGSQDKIIFAIYNILHHGKIMIEAETGSGKTIATLSALLARKGPDQKIIIFVKTINQFNSFLREWMRIENRKGIMDEDPKLPKFLILPVLGRNRICEELFHSTSKTIIACNPDTRVHTKQFQKLIAKNERSRLLRGINRKLLTTNATINDFTKLLQEKENCPYYNTQSMLLDADIVITTYPYLRPKLFSRLLKQMNIKVTNSLLIVDEAHNLAFPQPTELTKLQFDVFINFFGTNKLFAVLKNEFKGVRILDITKLIISKVLESEKKQIIELISIFLENKMLIKIPTKNKMDSDLIDLVKESVKAMKSFIENLGDGDLIITKEYAKIVNLSTNQILNEQKNADILVLQSATLTPLDAFRGLFGLPTETILLDLIERDIRVIRKNPQQFRASYVSAVSSEARFRNEGLYKRYAELIIKLQRVVPKHSLVLAPSYEFIGGLEQALLKELTENDTNGKINDFNIMVETALSTQKQLYDDIIHLKSKSIILGNQNGKILEGNEWVVKGKSIVNMVIFAGISSIVPQDEIDLLNRVRDNIIKDKEVSRLFQNQIPLYNNAKQAMGRVIRGIEDKGVLIILDHRADNFLHHHLWLYRYSRINELTDDISKFFFYKYGSFHQ